MKILILAAGRGSRFKSKESKVLTKFWGARVIDILIDAAKSLGSFCIITNEEIANEIKCDNSAKFLQSMNIYGTGAAVQQYYKAGKLNEDCIIIPGDLPLIDADLLLNFQQYAKENQHKDIIVGAMPSIDGAEQYGRIIQDQKGEFVKIAEYKTHPEKTPLLNSGIIYIKHSALNLLEKLEENSQGEVYLTDVIEIALQSGKQVGLYNISHDSALGFNTNNEFIELLAVAQQKWRSRAIENGAVLYDANTIYFSHDTKIAKGVHIEPYCKFGKNVVLEENAHIKAFSVIEDCVIDGIIGPFAHIKSGKIETGAQIGAFVEVSNSKIGKNTKAKHLAYLGNGEIGEGVNIGAGVVFCNYDGKQKHITTIKDNVSIGANSALIAPITVEQGAVLGAGGVYLEDIATDDVVIARSHQKSIKKPVAIDLKKK